MPRFSIVIPCYNAEPTLGETLASLAAQTVTDWEAICVDDGSTDGTAALVRRAAMRDGRIRLVHHTGKGPSAARNAGVRIHARGNIMAFCDADDLWHPHKLARLAAAFARPEVDGVFGEVAFYPGRSYGGMRHSTLPGGPLRLQGLLAENPVCTMSNLALRRGVFQRSGGFDDSLRFNEDLEFLVRLVGEGARIVPDRALHVYYRTASRGLSADLDAMKAGRDVVIARAARYGVAPRPRDEAVFARYLARRALRLDDGARAAFRFTLAGLARSPAGFLNPAGRGLATALAGLAAPLMPQALRRALFSA